MFATVHEGTNSPPAADEYRFEEELMMRGCLARPLTRSYSGCLQQNPECEYAVKFGFSYLCEHPRHKDFHPSRDSAGDHPDITTLYLNLRESRRRTYLTEIKEFIDHLEQKTV